MTAHKGIFPLVINSLIHTFANSRTYSRQYKCKWLEITVFSLCIHLALFLNLFPHRKVTVKSPNAVFYWNITLAVSGGFLYFPYHNNEHIKYAHENENTTKFQTKRFQLMMNLFFHCPDKRTRKLMHTHHENMFLDVFPSPPNTFTNILIKTKYIHLFALWKNKLS